ncbi:MAG: hypothetical protein D6798_17325 [Deltaproteobacteria bacterium]|nr:MAG: hypothetical protein D6798_17325 [Deltaproteobacteria bacterium]
MTRTSTILAILALPVGLAACDPFAHLPDNGWSWIDEPLWDAEGAIAADDGVYLALPAAGELARIRPTGATDVVDLDGASPVRLQPMPDGAGVVVFDRWPVCADPDPKIETVDDCREEDLSYSYELALVQDGAVSFADQVPSHLNRLSFSPDGTIAVAYLDYASASDIPLDGVVDLTQVAFIDLTGTQPATSVSVGFNADNVLFSRDGTRAVVLSDSQVSVIDLDSFEVTVTYPLTLDPDQSVDPSGAAITPDGRYALITIAGSADLYKLDLDVESIDILSLDATPSTLSINEDADRSVIVYNSRPQVDVLEHSYFAWDSIGLDEPCTAVLQGDGFALLYNDAATTHDVYKLPYDTEEPVEFVMGNPVAAMQLTDSHRYAVATLRPEASGYSGSLEDYQDEHWGLAVIDLVEETDVSLVLESEPVGVALVESEAGAYALVLLDGRDELLQLDLANPSVPTALPLDAPPLAIGAMPDDSFFITHDSALGLISFLDPTTGTITTAAGFGATDLQAEAVLPRRDQEN